jgi:MFS family permease
MGRERKHLIGLSLSTWSIAYIVGPIVAGYIARSIGEAKTFTVLGVFTLLVSLILLIASPKKLRLPQKEIKTWE